MFVDWKIEFNTSVLTKLIDSKQSHTFPADIFVEFDKLILKFIWKWEALEYPKQF